MITSYHVHSTFSDGKNSIRELVAAAVDMGLDELGISDHYVYLADGESAWWSMPLSALPDYLAQIADAEKEHAGKITVRRGVEADFDPASAAELGEVLRAHPFDYVIGSVHFVDGFPIDDCKENWDRLNMSERDDMIRAYWARIAQMAGSRLFDFAGHLDLYKKFGHLPTADISSDISAALDSIAASSMAVEINTSGWYKPDILEAYPSPYIISECRKRSIPFVITADAHNAQDLTASFDKAAQALVNAGYTEKAVYRRRRRKMVPL